MNMYLNVVFEWRIYLSLYSTTVLWFKRKRKLPNRLMSQFTNIYMYILEQLNQIILWIFPQYNSFFCQLLNWNIQYIMLKGQRNMFLQNMWQKNNLLNFETGVKKRQNAWVIFLDYYFESKLLQNYFFFDSSKPIRLHQLYHNNYHRKVSSLENMWP